MKRPTLNDTDLRNEIALICKLHGVAEVAYWNIADQVLLLIKRTLTDG